MIASFIEGLLVKEDQGLETKGADGLVYRENPPGSLRLIRVRDSFGRPTTRIVARGEAGPGGQSLAIVKSK